MGLKSDHIISKIHFSSENLVFPLTPQEWPKQNYRKLELTSIALTLHFSAPSYLGLLRTLPPQNS